MKGLLTLPNDKTIKAIFKHCQRSDNKINSNQTKPNMFEQTKQPLNEYSLWGYLVYCKDIMCFYPNCKKKLASLGATLVRNSEPLSDRVTGVKCGGTSVQLKSFCFGTQSKSGGNSGWIKSVLEWRELPAFSVWRQRAAADSRKRRNFITEPEFGCNTCRATTTPQIGLLWVSSAEELTNLLGCCDGRAAKVFCPPDHISTVSASKIRVK